MAKTSNIKSYTEFLKTYENGEAVEETFAKKRRAARQTLDKSASTYGSTAEALASSGLTGSGYASYLNKKAEGAYQKAEGEIALAKQTEENKRIASYEKYLEGIRKEQQSVYGQIHRSILSSKTTNYENAMKIARIYGLTDEEAKASVESAIALNIETKKQAIVDKIRSNRTSGERAVYYAQEAGLPEEVAEELREFAESLYGSGSQDTSYQNYQQAN